MTRLQRARKEIGILNDGTLTHFEKYAILHAMFGGYIETVLPESLNNNP